VNANHTHQDGDLTFNELRLASKLYMPPGGAQGFLAQLNELARHMIPAQTLERFMDGEPIDAHIRVIRQTDRGGVLAKTLADMVIQIDRFAAMNGIDLAAEIRKRFEPTRDTPT
jgi:hypothetical protein